MIRTNTSIEEALRHIMRNGMKICFIWKTEIMETKYKLDELKEAVHQKNEIINSQSKRIRMLEEKLDEVRHKYFNLKYFRFGKLLK